MKHVGTVAQVCLDIVWFTALCGCDTATTGLHISVEADQEVVNRTAAISLEIRTQEGDVALSERFDLAQQRLPIQRRITPRGGDASRVVTITAQAVDSQGNILTSARHARPFVSGQIVDVRLRLHQLCVGTSCADGQTCEPVEGRPVCVDASAYEPADASAGDASDGGTVCDDGFRLCGDTCAAIDSAAACGEACAVCPGDAYGVPVCLDGQCALSCNPGRLACGDAAECVDTQTDRDHCGLCNNRCPGEQLCIGGLCTDPPPCDVGNPATCVGLTYCLSTTNRCTPGCDPRLSNQCGTNAVCTANQCVCANDHHACGSLCVSNASINSCGAACLPCVAPANATQMGCDGTRCFVESCAAGYQVSRNRDRCEELDYCTTVEGRCDDNATCINTRGSRVCTCNPGFAGDGLACDSVGPGPWSGESRLQASSPGRVSEFGRSVAMSDDGATIVIGAPQESPSFSPLTDNGAAYVFRYSNGAWAQQARLIGLTRTRQLGARVALSGDGSTVAISAPIDDGGRVYIFGIVSGAWTQQAILESSSEQGDQSFGRSLALSSDGTTLAVGAPDRDGVNGGPRRSGLVSIFHRSGTTWSLVTELSASSPGYLDDFGTALALSSNGTTLAVGAYQEDSLATGINVTANEAATNSGAVYVFVRSNGVWSQQAFLKAFNAGAGDGFGVALAMTDDGNMIAVGAPWEDSEAPINGAPNERAVNSGAVYVFMRSSNAWTQSGFVKAFNLGAEDYFGGSVSLSDDGRALSVGALNEDGGGTGVNSSVTETGRDSGAAYVFNRTGATWTTEVYLKASNNIAGSNFGWSLALSPDGFSLIGGGPNEESDGGAVYTYRRR